MIAIARGRSAGWGRRIPPTAMAGQFHAPAAGSDPPFPPPADNRLADPAFPAIVHPGPRLSRSSSPPFCGKRRFSMLSDRPFRRCLCLGILAFGLQLPAANLLLAQDPPTTRPDRPG